MKNFFFLLIFLAFMVSCQKEEGFGPASKVHITIQNNTSSQPIAIRLTNAGWITVAPKNYVTYMYYKSFENVSLLAFTSDESVNAYNKASNCSLPNNSDWDKWYANEWGCTDAQIQPPYSSLKEFDFDARRNLVKDNSGNGNSAGVYPTITIIAESTDSLISGSVEDRNIKKVKFRVLD